MPLSDPRSVHKPTSVLNGTTGAVSAGFSNAQTPARSIGTRYSDTCRRPALGSKECHCSVCHHSMGPGAFDDHRRNGYCVPLPELGLIEVDGLWTTPEGHASRAASGQRLAALRTGGDR